MMRKVSEVGEDWPFPFSVIEQQDDGVIVDIPESYPVEVPVLDEDGEPVVEEILLGYDEEENPVYETLQVTESSVVEIDPEEYGEPATWADVSNLMLFDLYIGTKKYSWTKKPGFVHIGLKDGKIGIVKYNPVSWASGSIRKTIVPEMFGNPAIRLTDGQLSVERNPYADAEYFDMSIRRPATLGNIRKIKDGEVYQIAFPERLTEEEIV
ncbi:MAG: hypothetical protein JXQ82_07605 [Methanomicrobiaceae archaeon]|nr:hypothetical protein [Methanomicrobiaceae archaeon]